MHMCLCIWDIGVLATRRSGDDNSGRRGCAWRPLLSFVREWLTFERAGLMETSREDKPHAAPAMSVFGVLSVLVAVRISLGTIGGIGASRTSATG